MSSPLPGVVPPLSDKITDTVVDPFALDAGVNVSVPVELISGWLLNSEFKLFDTLNVTL